MLRIAFFASGRGSNMEAVLSHISSGDIKAEVGFVLSNNSKSGALQIARDFGAPTYHVSGVTEGGADNVTDKILHLLFEHKIDLAILAGYMKKVSPEWVRAMPHRIVNIHPALLPAFGGEGWYGHHIHEGVLKRGCQYTGITIHTVNEVYDEGTIIWQRTVPVLPGDSPEELGARVLKVEHDSLWRVVGGYADGTLSPSAEALLGISDFTEKMENLPATP